LAVKEYHEKTGRPLIMNEWSDMTEEEWKEQQQNDSSLLQLPEGSMVTSSIQSSIQVDDRIRRAYRQWCNHYGRDYDPSRRLDAFASNYVAVEKYHKQTKNALVLNQYADMTEEEYQDYLQTTAHFANSPHDSNIADSIAPRVSSALPYGESSNDSKHSISYLDRNNSGASSFPPSLPVNQIVQSGPTDETMKEVVSALQSTVASLTDLAKVLSEKAVSSVPTTSTPSAGEQPLDSLVIDVLKKQDDNIATLEDSVEGLRDLQEQSGGLIQLVSQNQMQMAEMMSTVQGEIATLQTEHYKQNQESNLLKDRVDQLEALFEQFKNIQSGSVTLKNTMASSVSSDLSNAKKRIIAIEPNPVGLGMSMFSPTKPRSGDEVAPDSSKRPNLENKRRPI
jgi:hypothetical protein